MGDACQLDLPDRSVDAVLLLGPLYHLPKRDQRTQALREARRIAKPGAPIFAAAISRWTPRLYAILGQKLYETIPETLDELPALEQTGWMRPLFPGSFSALAHRPGQLRAEIRSVGLQVVSLIGVEGVHYLLSLDDRIGDPLAFRVVLDSARALESVPEILGVSPHLLATTVRPHE